MPTPRSSRSKDVTVESTMGRIPPQDIEIEKVVLGALMIDSDAFTIVSEILHPETFYDRRHQKIYQAIQTLNMKETPADMLTVCEQLKRDGTYDEVGAPNYVIDLTNNVMSSANIETHANILAQKYMARQLITYSSKVQTRAFDEGQPILDVMNDAEGELFELSQRNMKQDYTQIDPVIMDVKAAMEKASKSSGGITGVSTGYTDLDKVTAGWQDSDLIIIAGRPAMGKTSFALSLAKNIAIDNGVPVAFFSLEMNNLQLVNRIVSNVCSIPGSKILNGQLNDDEWQRFDDKIGSMMGKPLYVDDTPGLSVFELRTKARRLVREKGVKLIMIDYLQLMNASGMRFNSRQEEVSTISRSLKGLAKIIALSQLSRDVEKRPGEDSHLPKLSDLRESGAIEQDADMVIFVHRPEYYRITEIDGKDVRGQAQIVIAKHRKGATKDVFLKFVGEFTRFANLDEIDPYASHKGDEGQYYSSGINDIPYSQEDDYRGAGTISNNDVPF